MNQSRLMIWGFVSGFVTSVIVTWLPSTFDYAPGVILGATLAGSFTWDIWRLSKVRILDIVRFIIFVAVSLLAYQIALLSVQWVFGANGFANFFSYGSESALPALFMASFIGGCVGSFLLSLAIRLFYFKFDMFESALLFTLGQGALSSYIIVGFEFFGFIPQFLFPIWHLGAAAIIGYLYESKTWKMFDRN